MELNTKFTSEELKGLIKQPEDSCPHLNEIILNFQKEDENFENKSLNNLENGLEVIERIKLWQQEWKNEFDKNKTISEDDPFVDAYIETAKHYNRDLIKININKTIDEIKKLLTQYQDEINIKRNPDYKIEDNEKATVYMDNQKSTILENVEKIREYASLNRKIGQSYKDAFKQISYEHEFNDIIQPIELIREEQGNKNHQFNLGIINHQKTFDNLVKNDYFEEHEIASFRLFNNEKIENMIIKRVKEKNPEVKDFIYYKNIDDFTNKKGYHVQSIIRPENKNNFKNKI